MSQYRETLHRWAAQHIPEGAVVERVDIDYDDGYEPTFTDRPASLSVVISYRDDGPGATGLSMEQLTSVGELLTALFAIEDDEVQA